MNDFSAARQNMVDGQIHTNGVIDERILSIFSELPREQFVPERLQSIAYTDQSLDLGQGRMLIAPAVYARMVQLADLKSDDVVLDIGSSYGYSSAVLANLVTTVIAVEQNKRQLDKAGRLWDTLGLQNIVLIEESLKQGGVEHAPYNAIFINGAIPEVPVSLFEQLEPEGRLVAVIQKPGQKIGNVRLFYKSALGDISSQAYFDASVPALKAFDVESAFEF